MTDADKLARLKRRLGIADNTRDALLADLLEDATADAMAYTGLAALPDGLDNTLCLMAAIAYGRLGIEGESSHSEGGVSTSIDGFPVDIKARLDRFRAAKVG